MDHVGAADGAEGGHRAEDGGAARHVPLHLQHPLVGLDGVAAGVEGDALADQANLAGLGSGALGSIGEVDQAGLAGTALPDGEDGPGAKLLQIGRPEDLHLKTRFGRDALGAGGHLRRIEDTGRFVGEVAREGDALRDGTGAGEGRVCRAPLQAVPNKG